MSNATNTVPHPGEWWADNSGNEWRVEETPDGWCDVKVNTVVVERKGVRRFIAENKFREDFRRVR